MLKSNDKNTNLGLCWPNKHLSEPILLPFQTIETINENIIEDLTKETWENRLIWGENFLVMSSLLKEFAGKIQLIYIDPPFATGQDFSYKVNIGDQKDVTKMPSALEVKAYRDTWGKGMESYLQMIYERLSLMKTLLTDTGSIYVHCDYRVNSYMRLVLDEIFGKSNFISEIIWKRTGARAQSKFINPVHDLLYLYAKDINLVKWNSYRTPYSQEYINKYYRHIENGRRFQDTSLIAPGKGYRFEWKGVIKGWRHNREKFEELEKADRLYYTTEGVARFKRFLDEMDGIPPQDIWSDISNVNSQSIERLDYPTQKPEALLKRIINASSDKGDLIADFFCGSGTTGVIAEQLDRRWIMADLGRFAIHTSRKRLLDINAKPFIVQNLGKYERQHWVKMNGRYTGYLKFILELYHAEVSDEIIKQFRQIFKCLHGRKGDTYIHIGNVDAPVTLSEIRETLQECRENKISKLVVLGWEWQLGLHEMISEELHPYGVKLRILQIPREVMELSTNDLKQHAIHFFELACLETNTTIENKKVTISLTNFIIPHPDLLPIDIKDKIINWNDYIDYWSVDWMTNQREGRNKNLFHNMDQQYRTRENLNLNLSLNHIYEKSGNYQILVKVIDIFGNDTTKMIEVKVS